MARLRNRILKADFWSDGELLRWPREKRFTYAGLYAMAEDSGCIEDDPFNWKVLIWGSPLDHDITVEMIEQWRDEMCEAGKLIPYDVGGKQILYITAFHNHEHPRNPQSPNLPLPSWLTYTPGSRQLKTRGSYAVKDLARTNGNGKAPHKVATKAVGKAVAKKPALDESFDMFWAFYPRREGRHKSEIAWRHLTRAERELAIGVAQVMGELFANGQKAKEHIKLPLTFIHGKNWEDWREGVPAGWVDSSEERAAQQAASIDAAIAAACGDGHD